MMNLTDQEIAQHGNRVRKMLSGVRTYSVAWVDRGEENIAEFDAFDQEAVSRLLDGTDYIVTDVRRTRASIGIRAA